MCNHNIVSLLSHLLNLLTITLVPESNLEGLRKVLLLLLGCSVQCDDKERYVHQITQLDLKTQEAIVEHIKEVG